MPPLEIESARERLQTILCILEQACRRDKTFDPQLLDEMYFLSNFLHDNGFNVAPARQGNKLVVEIEPIAMGVLAA
jgi:hypothetical protein